MRSWLCGIAWRKALSHQRSRSRRLGRDKAFSDADAGGPTAPGEEERLDLAAALAGLPLEQRAAVSLCLAADFSHAEAAHALDLPLGTLKSHVTRGRAKLLEVLGQRR